MRTVISLVRVRRHLGLIACLLCFFGNDAAAQAGASRDLPKLLTMYAGESSVLVIPNIKRVSVGKTSLVSATLLKNGEVILIAEASGQTNLVVWREDGSRQTAQIVIVEQDGARQVAEVGHLLKDIKGIKVTTVGNRIVVDGRLEERDLERVRAVQQRYEDILILARTVTEFEQKMLHFDVRITEISRDVTEELGVNWSTNFNGPNLNYERVWNNNTVAQLPAGSTNNIVGNLIGAAVTPVDLLLGQASESALTLEQQQRLAGAQKRSYTYWGIGTSIISMINLLESQGAAQTLTKPRLSARSGGLASLVVGGEIPVVTSTLNGPTVTYKDYGILLEVQPKLDQYNNIVGQVSIEVSALDLANAVSGQPAFRKRSSKNDIRIKPGETLALAGLIQKDEQLAYSGIKWLQDLPILGNLFRNKSFTSGETELVILITPTQIEDESSPENRELVRRADEIRDEFQQLKDGFDNLKMVKDWLPSDLGGAAQEESSAADDSTQVVNQ